MQVFPLWRMLPTCSCLLAAIVVIPPPEATCAGKPQPSKLKVEFTKGSVVINGTKLSLPIQRKDLVRLLGKPDRETRLANTILTWDELGIHAYQIPNTEKVRALHITMDREEFQFNPKKVFTGLLKVEGATITALSSIEFINRAIKPAAFIKVRESDDTWELRFSDSALYLREADPKTKSEKALFSSLQLDQREVD
jgi:hypothetical protein